ncbi:MAG: hypothetical protein HY693_01970 [Deltaproteobacteria bacterium]|nr:hypothetical protein [Deltaproteobacteria bacterium]
MEQLIKLIFEYFSIILLVLAGLMALVTYPTGRSAPGITISENLYRWISLLGAGVVGVYVFFIHAFLPSVSAELIGWKTSPFQHEVAVANLGFGILCILAFSASYAFRLASVIGISIWLWGDAIVHIRQMVVTKNFSPGNAGPWFWSDVLVPLLLIWLIIKLKNQQSKATPLTT